MFTRAHSRNPWSRSEAGFAIVVGLFAVSLLFLLTTLVVSDAEQNFAFTRMSAESARATMLADAGCDYALRKLNLPAGQKSGPVGSPTEASLADYSENFADGSFHLRLESAADYRVVIYSEGTVGSHTSLRRMTVKKAPAVETIRYTTLNGKTDPHQPDVLYAMDKGREWVELNGPSKAPDAVTPAPYPWAKGLNCPAGDSRGNLYIASSNSDPAATAPDGTPISLGGKVLFFDSNTKNWKLMPDIPLAQGPHPGSTGQPGWVRDITAGPGGAVFALAAYDLADVSNQKWPVRILYASGPNDSSWQELPKPTDSSGSFFDSPGPTDGTTVYAGNPIIPGQWIINCIATDGESLYMLEWHSNRIWRFVPTKSATGVNTYATGTWKSVPIPDKISFKVDADGKLVGPFADLSSTIDPVTNLAIPKKVDWLSYMAVDPSSNQVFARGLPYLGVKQPIDTIYRFTPDDDYYTSGAGVWSADPLPAPGYKYDRLNDQWVNLKTPVNLVNFCVDHAANLGAYLSNSAEPDTHYFCDLTQKRWQYLPTVTQCDPSVNETLVNCTSLGGGGIKEASGRYWRYIPVYND